jgi:DNA-binding CsgD family transcriptional regulator
VAAPNVTTSRRDADGGTALDPEVVARLVTGTARGPLSRLTPREREVLELMAQGRSNAAIGQRLFLSESAVGKHTASIFAKLDLPCHRRTTTTAASWPCSPTSTAHASGLPGGPFDLEQRLGVEFGLVGGPATCLTVDHGVRRTFSP